LFFREKSEEQRLKEVWASMRGQGFKTDYGLAQNHHLGKDNEIYVIPGGRSHKEGGVAVSGSLLERHYQ
jgi:hypothetical protein